MARHKNPKKLKGPAPLDTNAIKTHLQNALKKQILAQVGKSAILSQVGLEASGLRDGSEVPDEISTNNWLEWQHVYGLIPILVGERAHLRDVVGVFPPFTSNRVNALLEDAAELKIIQDQGLKTRVTPDGDVTLLEKEIPSSKDLKRKQVAYYKGLRTKRNNEAKQRREQAKALLAENNLGEDHSLLAYLEAIGESKEHFLGNPKNKNLTINDCEQIIIPFHYHDNHYTVAVIHFTEEDGNHIAQIKYYDSMGTDLRDSFKNQLIAYCQSLGFEAKYECVSKRDQQDAVHCSIFASFKSIDIANENIGNEEDERFLDKLTADNYYQFLNMLRYIACLKLKQQGQNVQPSEALIKAFKAYQEYFINLSIYSQKVSEINSSLLDLKQRFEKALNTPTITKVRTLATALPDMNPEGIMHDCETLHKQSKELLEKLQKKTKQTNKDKSNIIALQSVIQAFELANVNLQSQISSLAQLQATSYVGKFKAWLLTMSWKKLAIVIPIGFIGSLLGGSLALKLLLNNPIIAAGVGLFASGMMVISAINRFIYPESNYSQSEPAKIDKEAAADGSETLGAKPEVEEIVSEDVAANPALLNQFKRKTASEEAGAGSALTPIQLDDVGPSLDKAAKHLKARKRLVFE